jgi:hypothetical protein
MIVESPSSLLMGYLSVSAVLFLPYTWVLVLPIVAFLGSLGCQSERYVQLFLLASFASTF